MEEIFKKIINFIKLEIERTESFAEHDTQINIMMFVQGIQKKYNNGWIPCSERLPEEGHNYLICDDKGNVYSSTYCNNRWLVNFATDAVIAWQPLPAPYQPKDQ